MSESLPTTFSTWSGLPRGHRLRGSTFSLLARAQMTAGETKAGAVLVTGSSRGSARTPRCVWRAMDYDVWLHHSGHSDSTAAIDGVCAAAESSARSVDVLASTSQIAKHAHKTRRQLDARGARRCRVNAASRMNSVSGAVRRERDRVLGLTRWL